MSGLEAWLAHVWEMIEGRKTGPLNLRLILQPTMAIILAIRAGLRDAREDRPPYLWSLFSDPGHRRDLLRRGWKDVGKVFLIAVTLDVVYEVIVYHHVYPVQALLVGFVLAILPYLIVRGPASRIARRFVRRNDHEAPSR